MPLSFDSSYYLEQYPDVKAAVDAGTIESAEAHWEQYGAEEGRNPNAVFNTEEYLAANPDVAASGMNPLTHFIEYGAAEGRAPSDAYQPIADGFDTDAYLAANTDVAAAIESGAIDSAYEHWVLYGQFEDTREATYNGGTPVTEITDPASGETSDLTKGAEEVTGTAGDDTFNGVASALSSARTLDVGDSIDGGEGNDTLNVDLQSTFAGFSGDGGLTNVETVNLSNEGTIGRTFNATGVEGVEQYNLTGGVTLAGLESTDAAIALADKASGAVSIGYTDEAVEGDDDALSLSLENVGTVEDSETDATERDAVDVTVENVTGDNDAVESLALDVTGDNVVGLANVDATAITATGSGNLDVDAVGTALETFDASAVEGNVDADLDLATSLESVTTGAGDDTVSVDSASLASVSTGAGDDTITASDLRVNASIDGGEGDDRLNLSATGTVQYAMAGIETLSLANTDVLTFSAKNVSGIETIESSVAQDGAATFAGLGATDLNFELLGEVDSDTNTATITADQTGASTVNVVADADAEEDDTSVNDATLNLSKTNAVQLNVAEATQYGGTINAGNATSIEAQIDGALTGDAELNLGKATSAVFTTGEDDSTVQLVAGNLTDLNVTAGAGFELATDSDVSSVEALTVDTAGEFDAATNSINFDAVNQVNLSGTGQVTLADLGATDLEYGVTVNASGLTNTDGKDDALTIGNIDAGEGQSIEVNAADVLGSVTLTSAEVASTDGDLTGSINVNVDGITGAADLGTLTASDVTVEAGGALGNLGVDADNAVTITADTATVTGSGLGQNFVSVTASESATVTGGIQADTITAVGSAGDNAVAEFTLTGDLGVDTFGVSTTSGATLATITDFSAGEDVLTVSGFVTDNADDAVTDALSAALGVASVDGTDVMAFSGFDYDGGADGATQTTTVYGYNDAVYAVADDDTVIQLAGVNTADLGTGNALA